MLPQSPLVRKYLELSGDSHLLESVLGAQLEHRDAHAEALAAAVAAGGLPAGRHLPAGYII